MSSKQDRAYVRTAAALEQKYRGRLGNTGLEAEVKELSRTLSKFMAETNDKLANVSSSKLTAEAITTFTLETNASVTE